MSLAEDSCARHEEEPCDAHAEQVPASQERNLCEALAEIQHQCQGIGGEERRQRRCYDGEQA